MKPSLSRLSYRLFGIVAAVVTSLTSLNAQGEEVESMPWPAADEGQTRFVIRLPVQENEDRLKVEILVGKTLSLDSVNQYHFAGHLEQETIQGWGYPFWKVEVSGEMAATLIAVPEGTPQIPRLVPVLFDNGLIRYNSKLPVVVYVPTGFETRYRIWSAGEPLAVPAE